MTDSATTPAAHERVSLPRAAPEVYRALVALSAAAEAGLEPVLAALVKVRASQVNGCAFCLDMHVREAREAGVDGARIDTLAAWRAAPFYSDRERAALALTEALTMIAGRELADDVYAGAATVFEQDELAQLLCTIIAINAWNRLGIASGAQPAR